MALLFLTMGICAGDFFSVNLSAGARFIGMSDSFAGVTLLALGNGGPDIFSTWAAMRSNSPDLAVGELIGAASFIATVVAGTLPFLAPFHVNKWSLLRDSTFLLLTACLLLVPLLSGQFQLWHGLLMIGLYVSYVVVAAGYHWWTSRHREMASGEGCPRDFEESGEGAQAPTETDPLLHDTRNATQATHHRRHMPCAVYREMEDWRRAHGRCITGKRDYAVKPSLLGTAHFHRLNRPATIDWRADDADSSLSRGRQRRKRRNRQNDKRLPRLDQSDDRIWCTLFPSVREMGEKSLWHSALDLVSALPYLILKLTVPLVEEEHDGQCDHGWPRWLLVIQGCIAPQLVWAMLWLNSGPSATADTWIVPAAWCMLGSAIFFGALIYICSSESGQPRWYPLVSVLGFAMGGFWLSVIADEIVSILKMMGTVLGISPAILGFTVLAVGNSLDDYFADITISRHGHPVMAFAACFGGPLLNILLGLGSSITYVIGQEFGRSGKLTAIPFAVDPVLILSTAVIVLTLPVLVTALAISRWQMRKVIGGGLIVIWVLLTVVAVVMEVKHIS